jgi:PmbA protein
MPPPNPPPRGNQGSNKPAGAGQEPGRSAHQRAAGNTHPPRGSQRSHPFPDDSLQRQDRSPGASPIGGKLGKQVFDQKLSLWDDPTIAYRPHSRPCDDEGIASQRTPLIEEGEVASFLYDLQTAALANTKSTGNSGRGGGLPSPAPSAFTIAPGQTPFEEMVSDIKEGLVIEQLMGAEQGNILGGDFSGNVLLGYKVESGKIVGRVKDTMVSGNVYQVLKEVTAIGSEAKWVGGFIQTPPIYCPRLSVASKG